MKKVANLGWPDRLALLKAHSPSDDVACRVLGVTVDELGAARDLEEAGSLIAASDLDTSAYASLFGNTTSIANPKETSTLTSVVRDSGKGQPPLTATKKAATPKKRGRKGNSIATAFAAIPSTPVEVTSFAEQHGVSVAVLRQSKRFDVNGVGTVKVKKHKESGELRIWRETDVSA